MKGIKFYVEYDEEMKLVDKIKNYIEEHGNYKFESINIGNWEEAYDNSPKNITDYIVENKSKFPNLKNMYLGDIQSEECEISWITHSYSSALINELQLEELTIQGSNGLRLGDAKSDTLKKLIIISGGIPSDLLNDIIQANLPNLEHLELYIGIDNYGFDGDISNLEPFMKRSNFPNVKYLGLKNSEIQDEICEKILSSDIIENLEVLDISLGVLSDKGAECILNNINKLIHLKRLDLTHNYISDELMKKLIEAFENSGVELLTSNEGYYIDLNDDWRYPYITE